MASRTKQKEEARAQRLAQEQALAAQARRQRQLRTLAGLVLVVAALVAVVVAISSGGGTKPPLRPNSPAARRASASVSGLLAGIPQSGNTLGSPKAKVTVTEFGDLECSVCDEFALAPNQTTSAGVPGSGIEDKLISNYVRSGKIKLVYRSLETASSTNPDPHAFVTQQMAAEAAGLQNKEWNYVELFYDQQQPEGTAYVTPSFLEGLALEIPGLNYSKWQAARGQANLRKRVAADQHAASVLGFNGTPSVLVQGPKGERKLGNQLYNYSSYASAIKSVE
jgi:protein-disulfide isomerase